VISPLTQTGSSPATLPTTTAPSVSAEMIGTAHDEADRVTQLLVDFL
jgi:hypothetical protein